MYQITDLPTTCPKCDAPFDPIQVTQVMQEWPILISPDGLEWGTPRDCEESEETIGYENYRCGHAIDPDIVEILEDLLGR